MYSACTSSLVSSEVTQLLIFYKFDNLKVSSQAGNIAGLRRHPLRFNATLFLSIHGWLCNCQLSITCNNLLLWVNDLWHVVSYYSASVQVVLCCYPCRVADQLVHAEPRMKPRIFFKHPNALQLAHGFRITNWSRRTTK